MSIGILCVYERVAFQQREKKIVMRSLSNICFFFYSEDNLSKPLFDHRKPHTERIEKKKNVRVKGFFFLSCTLRCFAITEKNEEKDQKKIIQ